MRRVPVWLTCWGVSVWCAALVGCPGSLPLDGSSAPGNGDSGKSDPPESHVFALRVARHLGEPFSGESVDEVFAEASWLLQTVQTECPDVATDVTFARSGLVETFDDVPAVITTEADLDRVFALPQDIKIVHALVGVCGVELPGDVATILGCATFGGSVVIVAGAPADVWAHEWGHVQGLVHRDDCPRNLMHSFEIDTNAVNQAESHAFLTATPGSASLRIIAPQAAEEPAEYLTQHPDEPIGAWLERVVRRRYLAGVPQYVTADCDAAAVLRLREWCPSLAFERDRRNIIRMLGLVGDAGAVDLLVAQVLDHSGELSGYQFDAVAEAFLALGRLVEHDPSGSALGFLIEGTDPHEWRRRSVDWHFPPYAGAELHRLLACLSILALGISNSEAALAHLRVLRRRIDDGALAAVDFADQVDEAVARFDDDTVSLRSKTATPRSP